MDIIQRIRNMYFREGKSMRQIAATLHVSRNTVRRYTQSDGPWQYKLSVEKPRPVTEAIAPIISEMLEKDRTVRKDKQKHTATRIHARLVEEYGLRCSERTVRRVVSDLKKKMKLAEKEVYLPLEYGYGEVGEFDWGEAEVLMAGEIKKVNVFAGRLRASRAPYVRAFPTTRQETLLEAMADSFEYWQGVPATCRFDNPRTVVRFVAGGKRKENPTFAQFRASYNFDLNLCTPRKPNQKGSVENLMGFVIRHFFTPVPVVADYGELELLLADKCEQYLKRLVPGSDLTVGQALAEERKRLLPLPSRRFDTAHTTYVKSSKQARVCFDSHYYSVPTEYAHRNLLLKAYASRVEIWFDGQKLAEHQRSYVKGGETYRLEHYLDVLVKKPGAILRAKPVLQSGLATLIERFAAMTPATGSDNRRELASIMVLIRKHGPEVCGRALEMAIRRNCCSADAVACIATAMSEAAPAIEPLDRQKHPGVPGLPPLVVDVRHYDLLISRRCEVDTD